MTMENRKIQYIKPIIKKKYNQFFFHNVVVIDFFIVTFFKSIYGDSLVNIVIKELDNNLIKKLLICFKKNLNNDSEFF